MEKTPLNEVNIGDILRLALPLKTLVMGSASQARRSIKWVVLLTTWDTIEQQVHAGDLVIVPPHLQAALSDTAFIANLETFAAISIPGVLCFQNVSKAVAKAAGELGLPLLIAPTETAVRAVHQAIAALLIDRQSATSERAMQLYRQLSEMSREGQGLEAMTAVMSKLTGNIVVVQDKRLEVNAISIPSNSTVDKAALIEALIQRDQLPAVLRNRKAAAKTHQSYWQQILPVANLGRLVSPIISGDRARGYLSVIGPAGSLDLLDSLTVEHGAAACALEMAKAKAVSEAKKALRGDFLEGLLAGSLPEREIGRLSSRLDHSTEEPHAILTVGWTGENPPTLRRLETMINWLLTNHDRPALVHVYGGQHICIFQALKHVNDMETAHALARRLREQAEAEFSEARLIGGMSGPAPALEAWPRVYNEALQAMQLGLRLRLTNQIVEFNSLGIFKLLGELENIPSVKRFAEQIIGPLAAYDEQHKGSLVNTLNAYFTHHGNVSQTAESLFVHRNTLLYRLERIQELTGQDLDQADMRLAMQLALKFWQLRPETNAGNGAQ